MLVVRAGRDAVIPAARTQALIDALPRRPQILEVPDAGHDDVQDAPAYAAALTGFFENSPATAGSTVAQGNATSLASNKARWAANARW